MDYVQPYNLDAMTDLDAAASNDGELLRFFTLPERPIKPETIGAFQRYVTDQTLSTHAPRSDFSAFLHAPYEERPAPRKIVDTRNHGRDASRIYRERKKEEFVRAQTQLAEATQTLATRDREIASLKEALRQVSEDRDRWRQLAESRKAGSGSPVPNPSSAGMPATGISLSPFAPPGATVPSPGVPPLFRAPPAGAGLPGALAHPDMSVLRQEELQTRFKRLQELVETPGVSDDDLGEATRALSLLFYRRNAITPEMVPEILTPEFQLRNIYLNPSEEDVKEEDEEKRRVELHVWSQIMSRAGVSQEQFERFVIVRGQFKQALRGIMAERRELNKGLREYFLVKVGYTRTMNLSAITSNATDIVHASQLLGKLRDSFTALMHLRVWLHTQLDNIMSMRQRALVDLQVRQPTIYTSVALAAMTQLIPRDDMDDREEDKGGRWSIHDREDS